jgi:23S rRNA pseudouridine1911/1915/1917 synthase
VLDVLFEDADLLVVNKPAGLVCHPSKQGPESSLIGRARLHLDRGDARLINRLDRETSGIVVVAKHRDAARDVGRLFANGQVAKQYVAVVHGDPGADHTIDAPLGRDEASPVAIKDCVREDGAPARTRVRRLARVPYVDGPYSLVLVEPETGRKHQIRIHLASIGCPIVGDKIYGGDERRYLRFVEGALTEDDRASLVVPFQALHAGFLSFNRGGQTFAWHSAPPAHIVGLCGESMPTGTLGA